KHGSAAGARRTSCHRLFRARSDDRLRTRGDLGRKTEISARPPNANPIRETRLCRALHEPRERRRLDRAAPVARPRKTPLTSRKRSVHAPLRGFGVAVEPDAAAGFVLGAEI